MRETSKTYAALVCGALLVAVWPAITSAQVARSGANTQTCAALLSNDSSVGARVGVGLSDSASRRDTTTRARADSASFGVGGARNGDFTVYLFVGVPAHQGRFAKDAHV